MWSFFSAPLIADFFGHIELIDLSRVLFLWFLIGSTSVAPSAMLMKKMMFKERAKSRYLCDDIFWCRGSCIGY